MPTTMHVIRADEFIRLNAKGKLDLAKSRHVLAQVAATLTKRRISHAVLDFRQCAAADLSVADLYELASTLDQEGFCRSSRLALLYASGPGEKAKFFSLCASNRGWQVAAFPNLDEAVGWLFKAEEVGPDTEPSQPAPPSR